MSYTILGYDMRLVQSKTDKVASTDHNIPRLILRTARDKLKAIDPLGTITIDMTTEMITTVSTSNPVLGFEFHQLTGAIEAFSDYLNEKKAFYDIPQNMLDELNGYVALFPTIKFGDPVSSTWTNNMVEALRMMGVIIGFIGFPTVGLITDVGRNVMAYALRSTRDWKWPSHMETGSGSTEAKSTDTTLEVPHGNKTPLSSIVINEVNHTITFTCQFEYIEGAVVREVGLYARQNGTWKLVCREVTTEQPFSEETGFYFRIIFPY